jgi:PIN domain nuclease of toxin-antitoxin system
MAQGVLLDTHVFLSAYLGDTLPKKATAAMLQNDRYLSAASLWEVAIKSAKGKLSPISEQQIAEAARDLVVTILPITPQHIYRIFSLPLHHGDPFDRIIIATALTEQLALIGGDREFRKYRGLQLIWK